MPLSRADTGTAGKSVVWRESMAK